MTPGHASSNGQPPEDGVAARVLRLVAEVAGASHVPPGAGLDTPLADDGLALDSIALLELILACESEFEVTFAADHDLTPARLRTVGTLSESVRQALARRR